MGCCKCVVAVFTITVFQLGLISVYSVLYRLPACMVISHSGVILVIVVLVHAVNIIMIGQASRLCYPTTLVAFVPISLPTHPVVSNVGQIATTCGPISVHTYWMCRCMYMYVHVCVSS